MDKTKKLRMFIDILMSVLFLLLLNPAVTGVLPHEVLGIAITVLFIGHLMVNKKWIVNITRNFNKCVKPKVRAAYVFDAVIAISTGVSIVSGILVSRFLFPWLAAEDVSLWYDVHVVSSYLAFILLVAHTALHWRWIAGILKQFARQTKRIKALATRVAVGLIASAAVYSLIAGDSLYRVIAPPAQTGTDAFRQSVQATDDAALITDDAPQDTGGSESVVSATAASQEQVTLQEFLSKLYCTACHRRCPLTSPQCSTGVRQAEEQTAVYYAEYGQN